MIGKIISHYKIIEQIGSGGMGVVYKAEDTKLNRTVALKFLPHEQTRDEITKKRFIHEAQAASALQHTNIYTIHDIDQTDDGQLFICMDYYEGETLKKKIEQGPLKIDEALDISLHIAQGLTKAHEQKIIHRDIKPANILLTIDGVAKIVDFGLAKLSGRTKVTVEGATLGTVSYMSPEQIRGEEVDNRTDIWSLGVMLYEMITGQLPFIGEYDQAVIYSIVNEKPEPPTGLRTGIPMELERIINKALSKNPDERYQHADELAADLLKLLREFDISENIPVIKVTKQKSPKRKIKKISISVGILLSVFMLIIAIIFLSDDIFELLEPKQVSNMAGWDNSIAVLPFDNISADPEQEYFCDGMTEQIIYNLAKLPRLKVISRTSVMRYKDINKTIPEIGKELNVAHVLEGSVRKIGERVRVTAQLINTKDDFHLWTENYDREYKELFDLQDDVSLAIAKALSENLSLKEIGEIKTKRPANTEAYEYFLKARHFHDKYWKFIQLQDFKTSEDMYKKAIELDPNYASAYAYFSDLYNSYIYYHPSEKEKYIHLVEKYIEIALDLNPNSIDVLYIHADQIKSFDKKRYLALKKILDIDPNHFDANHQLGIHLRAIGLSYQSFPYFNKAVEVNPLDQWAYAARGLAYSFIGEFDKAEQDYKFALQIAPDDYWTMGFYTDLLIMLKRTYEAEDLLTKFELKYPNDAWVKNSKLLLMVGKGDSLSAIKFVKESGSAVGTKIALYLILDKRDNALTLMQDRQNEEGREIIRSRYLNYKHLLSYDNLRDDKRFKKILAEEKRKYEILLRKYEVKLE